MHKMNSYSIYSKPYTSVFVNFELFEKPINCVSYLGNVEFKNAIDKWFTFSSGINVAYIHYLCPPRYL